MDKQKLFFFNYDGDTRKVTCEAECLQELKDLVPLLVQKFTEQNPNPDQEYEFWTTDKQYGVRHKIEEVKDIYDGAVLEVNPQPSGGTKRGREGDAADTANKKPRRTGPRFVLRLRGLPWECTKEQIVDFFEGIELLEHQIIYLPNGRATGEGIVEVANQEEFDKAMSKNNEHIGQRYIEVFKSTGDDIDRQLGHHLPASQSAYQPGSRETHILRMRGLPYSALEQDIEEFFTQADVKPVKVHIIREEGIGRPSGIAYAEFETEAEATTALTLNRKNLGSRYIEIFKSHYDDLMRNLGQGGGGMNGFSDPYGASGGQWGQATQNPYGNSTAMRRPGTPGDNCIRMRGLPYDCSEHDITAFFQEAGVTPVRIHRKADGAEAFVEFQDGGDASKAMGRHKGYIKHRYIELFRCSYAEVAQTVGLSMHAPYYPGMGARPFF